MRSLLIPGVVLALGMLLACVDQGGDKETIKIVYCKEHEHAELAMHDAGHDEEEEKPPTPTPTKPATGTATKPATGTGTATPATKPAADPKHDHDEKPECPEHEHKD